MQSAYAGKMSHITFLLRIGWGEGRRRSDEVSTEREEGQDEESKLFAIRISLCLALSISLIVFCQFTNGSGNSLIAFFFKSTCFCAESSSQFFLFFSRRKTMNATLIEKFHGKPRTHFVCILCVERFG